MLNDPRDPGGYRIAIAALGLALAVLLAGICWIAAVHVTRNTIKRHKTTVHIDKRDSVHDERVTVHAENDPAPMEMGRVPVELWFVLGALGGVFVGALIPFSLRVRSLEQGCACKPDGRTRALGSVLGGLLLVVLLGFFLAVARGAFGYVRSDLSLYVLGATIAGVLLGLPIPSPGRRDS
jgi:hypothetical protein